MLHIHDHDDGALAELAFNAHDAGSHNVSALADIRNSTHVNHDFGQMRREFAEEQRWQNLLSDFEEQRFSAHEVDFANIRLHDFNVCFRTQNGFQVDF